MLRNIFQMSSGTGDAPPGVKNVASLSGPLDFQPDGSPTPRNKPFTVSTKANELLEVSFLSSSLEELRHYIPHAAAKIGKTEEEFWAAIDGKKATIRTSYADPVHFQLQCGGEEAIRSIAKSSLALLATSLGTEPLRGPAFADARNFVINGSNEFNRSRSHIDARPLPSPAYEHLIEAYGPMFNLIYVKSNQEGRTVAYFVLYNIFSWQIVLAETGGPENVEIGLASNPLDTKEWSDKVANTDSLDFEWLNSPEDENCVQSTERRLSAVIEIYVEGGRSKIVGNMLRNVLSKYYKEGDMIEMDERGKAAVSELSQRLAFALMRLPSEEEITITRSPKADN